MSARLFVGNLSRDSSAEALRSVFAPFGQVADVQIVVDRDTGRARGFAFVTMGSSEEAADAASHVNGALIEGRPLRVHGAEPRAAPRGTVTRTR